MIARVFLLGKWLFVSVIALMILTVISVSVLLYSSFGLNLVIWGAEKAEPRLTIASAQGRLSDTFSLQGIAYQNPDLNVDLKLKEATLSLDISRLLQPAISLNTLSASGLSLNMASSSSTTEDDDPSAKTTGAITSPLPIEVNNVQLNDINIAIDGINAHWNRLATGMTWRRSKLTLLPTVWQGIQVSLPADKASSSAKQSQAVKAPSTAEPFHFSGLTLPDVVIPLTVNIPQFTAQDINIVQGKQVQKIESIELGLSAKQDKVSIAKLNLVMPQVKSSLHGEAQLSGNYPLSLAAQGEYLDEPLQGQSIDLKATGSLADLSLWLTAQGKIKTEIKADVSLTKDNLPFSLSATNTSGYWPLDGEAQYQADIKKLSTKGRLDQYTFAINSDIKGTGIADIHSDMQGEGSLNSVNLERFVIDALEGQISGQITANWNNDITVHSLVNLNNFKPEALVKDAPGLLNGDVNASAHLSADNHWQVDVSKLDIKGDIKNYPLVVKGLLSANSTDKGIGVEVSTPNLVVSHGPNHITLKGDLAEQWDLNGNVQIADLSKSLSQSSGSVNGDIHLTGNQEIPHADIRLKGKQIKWQDVFSVKNMALNGAITSFTDPNVDLHLTLKNGKVEQQSFDSVSLVANGGIEQHKLIFTTRSPELNGLLEVNGQLDKTFSMWNGNLTKVELEHNQQVLKLLQPVPVQADITQQHIQIDPHCWGMDDASLCLMQKASISPEKIQAEIGLQDLSLAMVSKWLPDDAMTADGMVNGTAAVVWEKGSDAEVNNALEVGKGHIKLNGDQGMTIGWESASLDSELKNDELVSKLRVDLTDNGDIAVDASIPDVTTESKTVAGNLKLNQINLDFLQPLLGEYSQAGALINSNIVLSGGLLHPQARGNLSVTDLHASGELFPVEVKHGEVLVSLSGYQATMKAIVNTPDGDLNIDGDADWRNLSKWAVNSHVFADGLNVSLPPMVNMKVVPDITLAMTPDDANVSGSIKLPWGRIKVEELPESAVEVSSDQVIVDQHWDPVEQKSLPFKLATNVEVDIGNDFQLQAFGLKGYLDGVLKISQKENAPFVVGDVNITDGTYRSFGQDLVIQQGKVMLNGSVNKPYVSIRAIRNPDNIEDDVTAGIQVTGPADNPSVTVFSDPGMAQANALSYLLRGKNLDADSSGDNSMTTMLIGLSLAQSGHIVGELGQVFGVQELQLDTSGAGDDTQVNVSGYVLPDLQVKYGVGIFNSIGEFTLRYRLVRNLYVEAVSGLTSAVDLLYQFEFD